MPLAYLQALADTDEVRLATLVKEYGVPFAFTDPLALIGCRTVDAVLIAAPDALHATLTQACVAAGKPVLVEKPLATNSQDGWQVLEAETRGTKRLVQVGFMRQFDPAHQAVRDRIRTGDQGHILAFHNLHASSTTGQRQRDIADIMSNSLVHDINSARWMTGAEITQVFVDTVPEEAGPESVRYVLIQLRFDSGALGTLEYIEDSRYGYQVEVKVVCAGGTVESGSLPGPVISHASRRGRAISTDWRDRFGTACLNEVTAWTLNAVQDGPGIGPSA